MLSTIRFYSGRLLLFLALASVGVGAGLLVSPPPHEATGDTSGLHTTHNSSGFFVPAPSRLEELIEKADVIVVGRIGPQIQRQSFWGYDEHGKLVKAKEKNLPPQSESTFNDFVIQAEDVIRDDGTLKTGKDLVLRTLFTRTAAEVDPREHYPGVFPGDRYLFFLTQNPDQQTYGFYYAAASRLLIDGAEVTQSDGRRTPLPFARQAKPHDFIAHLKQVVNGTR